MKSKTDDTNTFKIDTDSLDEIYTIARRIHALAMLVSHGGAADNSDGKPFESVNEFLFDEDLKLQKWIEENLREVQP